MSHEKNQPGWPDHDSAALHSSLDGNGRDRGGLPNHAQDDSVMDTRVASLLDGITEFNSDVHSHADSRGEDLTMQNPSVPFGDASPNEEPDLPANPIDPPVASPSLDDAVSAPVDPADPTDQADLRIRGRADGVTVEIGEGEWPLLMEQLDARLEQSANFFRDGNVALFVGRRHLDEGALHEAYEVLERYGLKLGVVRTASDRTFDAALAIGLAATLESSDVEHQIVAHPAESNEDFRSHFVYRGNLRSGQVLHRKESVLIIGDVNPGANVISDGDILIWGRLRGVAHAGASGDHDAVIAAMVFAPIQLRIGHLIAIAPNEPSPDKQRAAAQDASKPARIAYVLNERIVVADWSEARRDNRWVLRRSVF